MRRPPFQETAREILAPILAPPRLLGFGPYRRVPICESFSYYTGKSIYCPLLIIYSKRIALVIAEVKFSHIAVKMLLTAMLIDALHAALEDAVVPLDRVCVE